MRYKRIRSIIMAGVLGMLNVLFAYSQPADSLGYYLELAARNNPQINADFSLYTFIHRGKSPKYSPIKKYPVVAQKCNQWDGFSIEKAKFIEPQSISSYNEEYFLQDRDLMWNSTGLGTLGRMAIYYMILNPYELAVADSHVTVIRPYKTHIVSEYLYYYFASNTVQSVIEDKSDGSTKQKELATKTVKAYLVPIPPFAEQQRIVQKIKSVTSIMS